MTETPEQFRERVAKVSFSAERPHTGLRVFTGAEQDRHQDMAEAVYAQALRDMMAWLDERAEGPGQHISITDGISLYEAIEHRLDERVISFICAEDIMDNNPVDLFAKNVRALRNQRGLSLRDLAQWSGVSPSAISEIETKKTEPSLRTALRLAAALGRSVTDMAHMDINDTPRGQTDAICDLDAQVSRLADVLMFEFEDAFTTTDGSEGACDMAIRVLREQKARLEAGGGRSEESTVTREG